MPFRSEKQRRYLWKFHPDIAERWTKEHGSKPVGKKRRKTVRKKKKSNEEFLRIILAQQTPPAQTATPAAPAAQAAPAGNTPQYRDFDLGAMLKMIPQIMGHVDSTDLKEVQKFMTEQMNIKPEQAQQASNEYAKKIYQEERAKAQQKIVEEVGKKLGVDPSKIPNLSQSSRKQMSIIRQAKLSRIVRTSKLKKLSQTQNGSFVEKVNSVPVSEKLKNLYKFVSGFSSIEEAVNKMKEFVDRFDSMFPPTGQSPVTASVGSKLGAVSAILWIVTAIMIFGAAGTDQMNVNKVHPNDIESARAIMWAFKSLGVSAVVTALAHFFKKREFEKQQAQRR